VNGLTSTVLPLAFGGAAVAAFSLRHEIGRPRLGPGPARGARWAHRRDLRRLLLPLVAPHPGRLGLGSTSGFGPTARLVAEPAQSLVVVGPTQSGKTSALAVPAILAWEGPVLAASVKSDLLRHTRQQRAARGQIWCIDPTRSTGLPTSEWTPLHVCADWSGARRMAADLSESAKADGTTADGEFWYATAAKLLAPLLFAAAVGQRSMAEVVRWIDTQEVGEVADILGDAGRPEAMEAAQASWCRDERTRSSVYTTAETILAPFVSTGAPSAPASWFEPARLLGGSHTAYLCAPAHDQRRLRGYFTALTQQVLSAAFTLATRSGRPLDPPLLVVLDEAAHIAPLAELDGLAATCASHGIQLVTVWQDLAQVRARYGARAPTVLNNHRAKLFLPGIADPDTLEYASRLVGDEETTLPSVTRDPKGGRSTTQSRGPRRLLPPEDLRCLRQGEAVLVYGTLPPARLRLRPWWSETGAGSSTGAVRFPQS
jgi:type IV secretion system protein VirD4